LGKIRQGKSVAATAVNIVFVMVTLFALAVQLLLIRSYFNKKEERLDLETRVPVLEQQKEEIEAKLAADKASKVQLQGEVDELQAVYNSK